MIEHTHTARLWSNPGNMVWHSVWDPVARRLWSTVIDQSEILIENQVMTAIGRLVYQVRDQVRLRLGGA